MKTKFNPIRRMLFILVFFIPGICLAQSAENSLTSMSGILLIYHFIKFFSVLSFMLLILLRTRWIAIVSLFFNLQLIIMSSTSDLWTISGWFVCGAYTTLGFQLMSLSVIFGWFYSRQTIAKDDSSVIVGSLPLDSVRVLNSFRVVFASLILMILYNLFQYVLTVKFETTFVFLELNYFIPILIITMIFWLLSRSKTVAWVIAAGYLVNLSTIYLYVFVRNILSFPEEIGAEFLIVKVITIFIQILFSIVICLTRVREVFDSQLKYLRWALVVAVILIVYDLQKMYYPNFPFE